LPPSAEFVQELKTWEKNESSIRYHLADLLQHSSQCILTHAHSIPKPINNNMEFNKQVTIDYCIVESENFDEVAVLL
jgi:hypothetical protein